MVRVANSEFSKEFCCEYNVEKYIEIFGGEKIEGCYVLRHHSLDLYQLVRHFVVKTLDGEYIDPTPFKLPYRSFVEWKIPSHNMYTKTLDLLNIRYYQETQTVYYVYCYLDPISDLPFYVGKGKGDRAYQHMNGLEYEKENKQVTRFKNKLRSLARRNMKPKIIFLAENIVDENIAYDIEAEYIKKYGRKGYDENGILLNICENANPPNWKGKTYTEIYGVERGEEQRLKRAELQKLAGGWYKNHKHSKETLKIISRTSRDAAIKRAKSREEMKILLIEFCKFFDFEISRSRLQYWAKEKRIPGRNDISIPEGYLIFCENELSAKIIKDHNKMWFHDPDTKIGCRISQWELDLGIKQIPEGYVRGRGISTFGKKKPV